MSYTTMRQKLTTIANNIRAVSKESGTLTLDQMAEKITHMGYIDGSDQLTKLGDPQLFATYGTAYSNRVGAATEDYIVMAGGYSGSHTTNVQAISKSGTVVSAPALSTASSSMNAETANSSVIVAGGATSGNPNTTIYAYSNSLTRTTKTNQFSAMASGYWLNSASIDGKAVFYKEFYSTSGTRYMYTVNDSLTVTTKSETDMGQVQGGMTATNNKVFLGGGLYSDSGWQPNPFVRVFSKSLTFEGSVSGVYYHGYCAVAAVKSGGLGIFYGGGYQSPWPSLDYCDAINESRTRTTFKTPSSNSSAIGTSGDSFATFIGGTNYPNNSGSGFVRLSSCVSYDKSLSVTFGTDYPYPICTGGTWGHASAIFNGDLVVFSGTDQNNNEAKNAYRYPVKKFVPIR